MRFQIILLAAALTAGLGGTGNIPPKSIKQVYITPLGSLEQSSVASISGLYTSMEKEKGKYTDKVKALFNQLLDGLHASH